MNNEFDEYASTYQEKINKSISVFGQKHDFFVNLKTEILLQAFSEIGELDKLKILDVGCGIGLGHEDIINSVGELYGVDVSVDSIDIAKNNNPQIKYDTYVGRKLPFKDGAFDCAYAICVLHHIPKGKWQQFIDEIIRVLKPGGQLVIIEHNPFNPATQWIVKTCELDKDAILLSPWRLKRLFKNTGIDTPILRYTLFTPFSHKFFRNLDRILSRVPFGAQYIIKGCKASD
jgi:ubiquinone/menaquinone biosynthesis C-methylase UbiE